MEIIKKVEIIKGYSCTSKQSHWTKRRYNVSEGMETHTAAANVVFYRFGYRERRQRFAERGVQLGDFRNCSFSPVG